MADHSQTETQRLEELFQDVELPEITGIDFGAMSHEEIAALLPAFGGQHPAKAILIDNEDGKAYGIASGWKNSTVSHNNIDFESGAIGLEIVAEAGGAWKELGNHTEAVASAFMRKMDIQDATLYINVRNPCWGASVDPGCYYRLPEMLAPNSNLSVYNKVGADCAPSWPDRKFHFEGLPDKGEG